MYWKLVLYCIPKSNWNFAVLLRWACKCSLLLDDNVSCYGLAVAAYLYFGISCYWKIVHLPQVSESVQQSVCSLCVCCGLPALVSTEGCFVSFESTEAIVKCSSLLSVFRNRHLCVLAVLLNCHIFAVICFHIWKIFYDVTCNMH